MLSILAPNVQDSQKIVQLMEFGLKIRTKKTLIRDHLLVDQKENEVQITVNQLVLCLLDSRKVQKKKQKQQPKHQKMMIKMKTMMTMTHLVQIYCQNKRERRKKPRQNS